MIVYGPCVRFNRYIVECKEEEMIEPGTEQLRFNRYIVECKGRHEPSFPQASLRFNRYIVECKGNNGPCVFECNTDLIDTLWNVKVFR